MMTRTITSSVSVLLAMVATLLGPAEAQGQSVSEWALELEEAARQLHDQQDRWGEAANLYMAAAQLRQPDDRQGYLNLELAANLWNGVGDKTAVVAALEAAAIRARGVGDTAKAATLFVLGARIAREAALPVEERRLRHSAVELRDDGR